VCIARARARASFPARPLLVAAVNPCPCGHFGHPRLTCRCSVGVRDRYRSRLSGPLLDRIDIHVNVPPVDVAALVQRQPGETSAEVRARVLRARRIQGERARSLGLCARLNGALPGSALERVVQLDEDSKRVLARAAERLGLSARAFGKILRVARTIADLEGSERVTSDHVGEAVLGRILDRSGSGL
jgi:magnesium chelatase family protein